MDYLRQGHLPAWLRAEAAEAGIQEGSLSNCSRTWLENVKREVALEAAERQQAQARLSQSQFQHQDAGGYSADEEAAQVEAERQGVAQLQRDEPKIGRNDPCPLRQWARSTSTATAS
ncbi:unnamed protein product [Cylicocyclus nassatus]|uniref:Uncharacterized protein n=1 Tax=Cylicocyclus nassatus TaxID=53992 RepID=A0AA36MFE7_CYLNA|nr:unnamed protein product [Cylicocyclus nassatus]